MDNIAKRSDKVAFLKVGGASGTYKRMRGFTEFSLNKNPIEYSRRYVDERTERNDVVGYSPEISYSFDKFSGDDVHADIISVNDSEKVGQDAVRSIVIVDISATGTNKPAYEREWAIIPDTEGNDTDAYTYSGTLKANGEIVSGTAASSDDWQTCTFTETNG